VTSDVSSGRAGAPLPRRVYDGDGVDRYLTEMQQRVDGLRADLVAALDRAAAAERRLEDAAWSEELIGRTIVLAQRQADQAVRDAQEEAASILADARQRALAHLAESRDAAEDRLREAADEAERIVDSARATAAAIIGRLGEAHRRDATATEHSCHEGDDAPPALARLSLAPTPDIGPASDPPPPAHPSTGRSEVTANGHPDEAVPATSGASVMLDIRDRWRAARTGSVALFEETAAAAESRAEYLAVLRSAVEEDAPSPDRPDWESPPPPSPFEAASHLVAFPPSIPVGPPESESVSVAGDGAAALALDGDGQWHGHASRPLGRFGFFILSIVSPSSMTHRHRR
jgi:hypothetical protein